MRNGMRWLVASSALAGGLMAGAILPTAAAAQVRTPPASCALLPTLIICSIDDGLGQPAGESEVVGDVGIAPAPELVAPPPAP
jgi:hypothetical protein